MARKKEETIQPSENMNPEMEDGMEKCDKEAEHPLDMAGNACVEETPPETSGETKPEDGIAACEKVDEPPLESLSVLANRHRVPGWRQAALMRMMGWENGKMVSEKEYMDALGILATRRLGGGRLA